MGRKSKKSIGKVLLFPFGAERQRSSPNGANRCWSAPIGGARGRSAPNCQHEILPKNHHWLYFDSKKVLFNRITENKKLTKFVCPKESSFLTLEITYTQGDKFSKINPKAFVCYLLWSSSSTCILKNSFVPFQRKFLKTFCSKKIL